MASTLSNTVQIYHAPSVTRDITQSFNSYALRCRHEEEIAQIGRPRVV